ncbi:hypothetical protein TSOC_005550 [Tetrabaena socialis]|uniref:Uncharacterized protein n=1 Tax=Tetrabaena socialis TaxID=47790 RepID=A0A2J8A5X8_9CHLO|nr:hypothetical protein TSOC_005550 [Tetrabaena socialis]|eukprot:PNH07931.1 hypothetical protein TSOC_005550 [Tetrabaena socialis]
MAQGFHDGSDLDSHLSNLDQDGSARGSGRNRSRNRSRSTTTISSNNSASNSRQHSLQGNGAFVGAGGSGLAALRPQVHREEVVVAAAAAATAALKPKLQGQAV